VEMESKMPPAKTTMSKNGLATVGDRSTSMGVSQKAITLDDMYLRRQLIYSSGFEEMGLMPLYTSAGTSFPVTIVLFVVLAL
jgi:hypothetical protein